MPVGDEIAVLYFTTSNLRKRQKERAMILQENDKNMDKLELGLPTGFTISECRDGENYRQQMSTQEFISKQARTLYCRHACSTFGLMR